MITRPHSNPSAGSGQTPLTGNEGAAGRIFYLGGIDLPMRQARAVQTLHTAHAMARLGCRVTLAVGRAPRDGLAAVLADYGLAPHQNLAILPLPTLRLPRLPISAYVHPRLAAWNWSYGLAALLALLRTPRQRRADVLFARDPRLADLFLRARPLTGVEVAYEVHELFSTRAREPLGESVGAPDWSGNGSAPPTRTPRVRVLEEAVFRQARLLVTLTQACKSMLSEEFDVPPERILVAPDAVAEVPSALPPLQIADGQPPTIVYAGQLYPWKGVGTLIRALRSLPEARLKIVGGLVSGDEHAEALRSLALEQGVFDRLDFTGFLPHVQVAEATKGASAAVVPLPDNPMGRYFTSPLKLYEYMAAGLPIVASDLPALGEVLRHEQNALLVPPDDPAALAEALRRVLEEPALAERLRSRAHADVTGRTWSARAAAILGAIAAASGPPASES